MRKASIAISLLCSLSCMAQGNDTSIKYMKLRVLTLYSLIFSLSACVSVNGSGYESLTDAQKGKVVRCESSIGRLGNGHSVYQITVAQLKEYLDKQDSVIVYEYLPFCSSENCVSPILAEKLCTSKGYSFCLVATTYDGLFGIGELHHPILAIDFAQYHTNNYKKYGRAFYKELTGKSLSERGYGRYHLFVKGKYQATYCSIR